MSTGLPKGVGERVKGGCKHGTYRSAIHIRPMRSHRRELDSLVGSLSTAVRPGYSRRTSEDEVSEALPRTVELSWRHCPV
jgi:hypothetical protein